MTPNRRARRRAAASAVLVLVAAPLAACAPEAPPEPERLSASQAGGVYLDAVCPVNAAWDDVDVELDRLRLRLDRGEAAGDGTAQALIALAEQSARAAQELGDESRTWPASAAEPVAEVRRTLLADREQADELAKLSGERIAAHRWVGGEEAGAAADAARAALKLPEDPEFACSEWRAQQRAETETPTPESQGDESD